MAKNLSREMKKLIKNKMYIDKNDQSIIKKFENRGFLIFKLKTIQL